MRVGIIRIFHDGLKYFLFRFLLSPFLTLGNAKIIVSSGALWIDFDRLGQFGDGVVEFGLPVIDDSKRGVHKFVPWRNRQSLFQSQLRSSKFATLKINDTEIR